MEGPRVASSLSTPFSQLMLSMPGITIRIVSAGRSELEELRKRACDLRIEQDELEHQLREQDEPSQRATEDGNLTTEQALDISAKLHKLYRKVSKLSALKEDILAENATLRTQVNDLRIKSEATLSKQYKLQQQIAHLTSSKEHAEQTTTKTQANAKAIEN